MTSHRAALRALVAGKQGLVVPGAYDGISARLVQDAGYPAVYMTGYGTAASRLGLPDLGFAGLGEMADHARNLAAVLDVPLIADADTGYGNALNVRRTVQTYEAAGVAALHIEDQITPKRCGHLAGHQIVPRGEFVGKIACRGRGAHRPGHDDHRAHRRDLGCRLRRGAAPRGGRRESRR
jgi:2,3-dimethylmalate lyase